ncbi:hypothetical protein DWU99_12800 [Dyella psychrodurans]|uniref:Phytanoyl-CoA dioxygenase n=2 Tax=Dyella psychrodurans TaxID=1927960 RepID=A0A370X581_9GAMM|nr:hypothetical protein DWU99_12800 [Dyella psychrodurans]
MMLEQDSIESNLILARTHMQRGHFTDAIALLRRCNRQNRHVLYEQLLAQCQYEIYVAEPPRASNVLPWPEQIDDVFAGASGLPEIRADQLNARTLAAGIQYHGALIVRGLLTESKASEMAAGVRRTLDSCGEWHQKGQPAFESPWYWRLPLSEECELAQARFWVEGACGVWTVDSPRMLFDLTETLGQVGVIDAIAGYFGERPLLSVGKSTLRCVPSTIRVADWHQDGAFMGGDIRSVNVWLSLSHCGEDASGLEVLPRRLPRVLPTGTHGANFEWSVGPGMVELAGEGMSTVSPVFAPGDAMLFDHYFLHRTGIPEAIAKDRYAIESWFFAPSAYPQQQLPLWL